MRFAFFLAVLVGACSSSSGSSSGAVDASAFMDGYCKRVSVCCENAGLKSACTDGIAAVGGHYDAEKGQSCLAELDAAAANGDFCDMKLDASPSCNEVLVASGADGNAHAVGDACANDTDCAPLADAIVVCGRPPGTSNGTCRSGTYGKAGDPCVGTIATNGLVIAEPSATATTGSICEAAKGLYCDPATAKCGPQKPAGEACDSSTSTVGCEETASCDLSAKACVARKGAGEKCASTAECEVTAQCASTSKCVTLKSAGAACDGNTDCFSGFCNPKNQKCAPGGPGGVGAGGGSRSVFCN